MEYMWCKERGIKSFGFIIRWTTNWLIFWMESLVGTRCCIGWM